MVPMQKQSNVQAMKVSWSGTFDAAHWIPGHPGKCKNMHGHTWKVEVSASVPMSEFHDGMLVDFGVFKKVVEKYDHTILNRCPDVLHEVYVPPGDHLRAQKLQTIFDSLSGFMRFGDFDYPSAENIANRILNDVFSELITMGYMKPVIIVKVWESEHSYAEAVSFAN